ncbi:hypothetical protein PIB30_064910 [Stylosanthes scabra]|uniref:Uncharacterized protein n=1 Tax=Stylosanthes scabra TaxID=79078 RepID=A0ABU6SMJ2_9FABA|nr:hypothetical protein [Stylosanthes scabra]
MSNHYDTPKACHEGIKAFNSPSSTTNSTTLLYHLHLTLHNYAQWPNSISAKQAEALASLLTSRDNQSRRPPSSSVSASPLSSVLVSIVRRHSFWVEHHRSLSRSTTVLVVTRHSRRFELQTVAISSVS